MTAFTRVLCFLFLFTSLIACGNTNTSLSNASSDLASGGGDNGQIVQPEPVKVPGEIFSPGYEPEPLSWETSSRPERENWSEALYSLVNDKFETLDKSTDIEYFCANYDVLNRDQKINLWADLIASTTYYESGYNPKSYSVDVGTDDNRDTWSVGLLQLSVVDQKNYGFQYGFDFEELQDPVKNLTLGMQIFSRQIARYGTVMIPVGGKGLYWAVLHPGGKYDKSAQIAKMTKGLSFCQ